MNYHLPAQSPRGYGLSAPAGSGNEVIMRKYSEDDLSSTQYFKVKPDEESGVRKVLSVVYEALSKKGYDPVNQIVGYIMSGDPTYITSFNGARSLIVRVERDEILDELIQFYIEQKGLNR